MKGLGYLREFLRSTLAEYRSGVLRHPRDAELNIIMTSKVIETMFCVVPSIILTHVQPSFDGLEKFTDFVHTVVSRFDMVMEDPRWREHSYVAVITEILALAEERRILQRETPTFLNVHTSTSSHALADHVVSEGAYQRHVESVDAAATPSSISGMSSAMTDTTHDWTHCPVEGCRANIANSFTGNSRRHNCKRHIKEQHGEVKTHRCHACPKTFSLERNLSRHIGQKHMLPTLPLVVTDRNLQDRV